jgi:CHAT domain-containing protein
MRFAKKVAAFRCGLDVSRLSDVTGKSGLFDLALANELYGALLGPVEALVKDKRSLLIGPSGALTALPFHVLVTEKPSAAIPETLAGDRDVAWLIRRQAVSVLPSVASLKALRAFARNNHAARPMTGFGDPLFDPAREGADKRATSTVKMAARSVSSAAYTDFWRGADVDRARLAAALAPLPDTADELHAVARDLGASPSDIHLGADASETTLKRASLADYAMVYFATHGLVAGDVKGMAEPSLAQSIPKEPSEFDDDLLTASEVAELKLNADWVVLSACNTIAGDSPGAEALSGLARVLLCRRHGAFGDSLGGCLRSRDTADHIHLRSPEGRCLFVAQRRRCDRPCWPISTTRHRTGTPLRLLGTVCPDRRRRCSLTC